MFVTSTNYPELVSHCFVYWQELNIEHHASRIASNVCVLDRRYGKDNDGSYHNKYDCICDRFTIHIMYINSPYSLLHDISIAHISSLIIVAIMDVTQQLIR